MKKLNNFCSSSSITPLYSYSSQTSDNKNIDELIKNEHLLKHSSTDYEKIKIVGKGSFGMAVLYKRKDDESFVILKEINLHELNNSERQMALNEVNLLSKLDHPHIIAFYDSFEEDGTLMIEMEYADGGTLSQLLFELTEPLIELEIIDMFEQMLEILELAKKMSIETKINGAQTILGTPYYLSPEMCEGKSYNEKSDIWALGCCFYEMCTLNKAFDADNLPTLLNKIINSEYEPLKKNYSQEVRLLIREMLRILPEQRPTSSELLNQVRLLCSSKEKKNIKINNNNNILINNSFINSYSALYVFDILNITLSSVQEFPKRIQIKQIAVNESHQLILTIQGQVFSWGNNSFGQLGHGDLINRQFPTLIESLENKNVYKIATGKKFSIFCAGRGIVLITGKIFDNDKYEIKPKIVESLLTEDIIDIRCGDEHLIALTENGEVFVWGKNKNGQLGIGNKNDVLIPIKIQIPTRQLIKCIICGPDSTMLITNSGNVLAMGSNKYNKLNLNKRFGFFKEIKNEKQNNQGKKKQIIENALLPTAVRPFPRRVVNASLGNNHSGVLLENGNVHLFGLNSNGELGNGNILPVNENTRPVKGLINKACMHLICGDGFTMIGTLDNEIYFWGLKGKEKNKLKEKKKKKKIKY
ncbi:Protein kinase domain-containing protein [Meloidogyne graminicola]|uniref:non-specific serine/threonine protein kinase n=1 Tax=Meloidogyne graminicola TaxID=189291 RepID=A0A8S9ZWF6_9BILA|nr:Protein kinase domain-containing protein [Meloidogyne graminicola]